MLAGSLACLLDAVSLHYRRPAGARALPGWFMAAPPVPGAGAGKRTLDEGLSCASVHPHGTASLSLFLLRITSGAPHLPGGRGGGEEQSGQKSRKLPENWDVPARGYSMIPHDSCTKPPRGAAKGSLGAVPWS